MKVTLSSVVAICALGFVLCENKYSKEKNSREMNEKPSKENVNRIKIEELKNEENPFRVKKTNMLWAKAKKRLSDEKLKAIYSELKIQDKKELQLKRMKAEGQDKDGLKEADIRNNMIGIMRRFDLLSHFDEEDYVKPKHEHRSYNEATDKESVGQEKRQFKDKKLNKLWQKAEKSGFTPEELKTLREEFDHHRDKIEEYYQLRDKMAVDGEREDNSIHGFIDEEVDPKKALKEKYGEIKKNYERSDEMAADDRGSPFEESRVQHLWNLAKKSAFGKEELESLEEELLHYQRRIKKLKFLREEVETAENHANSLGKNSRDFKKRSEMRLEEYANKMDRVHYNIESRIMQRHLEL